MKRRFLPATAIAAMICVLFVQLALSAFACPGDSAAGVQAHGGAVTGCDEMPGAPSPLCQPHCEQLAQSLDKAEVPPIAPACEIALVPRWRAAESEGLSRPLAAVLWSSPPQSPPIPRNCCLRL